MVQSFEFEYVAAFQRHSVQCYIRVAVRAGWLSVLLLFVVNTLNC